MTSAEIPSLSVSVIKLGPLTIHFYALFILTGIVLAYWWASKRWEKRGGDSDQFFDIAFAAIIAGIIGARMYHVLVNIQDYFGPGVDPLGFLKIWEGGLGIWGAVCGGALAAWIMARRKGANFLVLADSIAPTLFVAQAIGRLGNWANQELYGEPLDAPWALRITCELNGQTISGCIPGTYQPTFLYEALWNLAACAVVIILSRRLTIGGGRVFLMYVIGYSLGRIVMEMMRTEPSTMVWGLRIHMVIYIVTALLAALVFAWASIRAHKLGEPLHADGAHSARAPQNGAEELAGQGELVGGTERSDTAD